MAETNGKLISELKVHELRSELIGRGLDGNGVKAALVARLEKALSEQGVDINSYLFSSASDTNITSTPTTTTIETENNDGTAAALAVVAPSKDETGKNKEAEEQKKEAVPENVVKTVETQATTENKSNANATLTADVLIEKVEDEIDEAELHGETEDAVEKSKISVNGNGNGIEDGSPDIGDLEEREESEGDDVKNENISMETESENKAEQQQISAIHEISDEEDLDEDMLTDDAASQKPEKKEDEKTIVGTKTDVAETKDKLETENSNKEEKSPTKPRIPAGLNFPSDDPNGLRCIWIRALPYETRLSELKLAFIDAGFTVESAKIFTTKQSSRPSAFGFMTLSSQDGAKNAVAKMNNSIFKGKVITVERASDASMLASSDLLPRSSKSLPDHRPKVHPPIKPPEDDKPVVPESSRSRIITTSRSSRPHDNSRSRPERHRSPYMNTVNRGRIVRAEPQRIVEASGRSIRVVTTRGSSRSSRPSRHSPTRPSHRERERTPPRRHRTPDHERMVDHERRRYEDIMRKKEEEFKRKEEALRIEAERNRIKLEKERLEKENLELKLRLQQEQLRAAANVSSSSRRGPSPHSTSRHRGNTPPVRRSSPPRSSRHASPPPRHHPSSRRTPERHESRHHTSSSNYRQEPPPKEAYPARRRTRSRSPVRTAVYERSRPDDYSRSGRPQEHGSSRHPRAASPVRNVPPPPGKYERHSPRRNYESSRNNDRSRRNDKIDIPYPPPIEEPQRSSRSNRNGGVGSGRDFPSNNYDRSNNGNSSFESTRRESGNHFIPPQTNIPVTTYNLATDYRSAAVNPSYSATPGNSRNQLPTTWSQQQSYAAPNQPPQTWAHQPQNIANIPQWNPFNSSGGGGMRGNNSNQRYGGF